MGYVYQADVYCDECGEKICQSLRGTDKAPEDEMDQHSYDSDDFPKSADVENEESDTPQHCGGCHEFLSNPLTSEGYQYVQSTLNEKKAVKFSQLSEVENEWARYYNFRYWDEEDCEDEGRDKVTGWYSSEMF